LPRLAACKGHLGDSAQRLKECFELQSDVFKRYLRLVVYANEQHAQDTGDSASLELQQKVQVLGSKLRQATSFVNPEILAVGQPRIEQFLRDETGLAIYRHDLDDILRTAPHTLDGAGEAIVAQFALAARQSGATYNILANADMPWPTVKLADGKEVKLD